VLFDIDIIIRDHCSRNTRERERERERELVFDEQKLDYLIGYAATLPEIEAQPLLHGNLNPNIDRKDVRNRRSREVADVKEHESRSKSLKDPRTGESTTETPRVANYSISMNNQQSSVRLRRLEERRLALAARNGGDCEKFECETTRGSRRCTRRRG